MTHWLTDAVTRAMPGITLPPVAPDTAVADAWAAVAGALGADESEIARLVAEQFRLRRADLSEVQRRALKLVPESFARKYLVLPLRETDRQLVVATANPADFEAEQALGFASGRQPVFEIAGPRELREAIDLHYSPNKMMEELVGGLAEAAADAVSVVETGEAQAVSAADVDVGPVVKLTNVILRDAVLQRASDVHLEPGRGTGVVRFRVDGVLRRYMQLPMPALVRVISRIKVIGDLDIADRLRPQDGRTRVRIGDTVYDLRISTVPAREAEKAVIRLLNPAGVAGLKDIALPAPELARLRKALSHRDGILVVTGPTGSGKSTTLYSCLRELATEDINIMTVEDPVEYELQGVTQIQVEPRQGVTFGSALRAILRQDPDVIFIGEIRDLETAEIAVQAAMTGHLVLATLHTNDAVGAVQRLLDLGLDRPSIAGALRGALAQRLVRRLCIHCSRPAGDTLPPEEAELAARYHLQPAKVAVGCDRCGRTGYSGRFPVAEFLAVDTALQELILKGGTPREMEKAAMAAGMRPMAEVAREPVRAGLTTLSELERVLGERAEDERLAEAGSPLILLVDDDTVSRTLAKTLLVKSGYRVAEATDGVVALEKLKGLDEYALMILDLEMPRLGGREVLRHTRSDARTASLPVIILTGTADMDAEIELMEAGADDYIRKPIDPARFVSRVRAALRRAGVEGPGK